MLACTEMITMCLQSAKRKHVQTQHHHQQQQQQQNSSGRGLSILHDIFRRADKNDDGKLSFEEFNAYFADGVLTTAQLQELFYSIDGRQNNNLDTDKLSDYFSQHLGEYVNVLSALEKLNVAILKAMYKTKEEYQDSSVLGQFVTRFLLRQTSAQLLSLQRSLQCAKEAVDEESVSALRKLDTSSRSCGHRIPNNLSHNVPPRARNTNEEAESNSQIARLRRLLDQLECQGPKLEPVKLDTPAAAATSLKSFDASSGCRQNILLLQRKMAVNHSDEDNFRNVLKSYVDATAAHSDNLHVSIQKVPEKSSYVIYEFWRDRASWMSYLQSSSSKDFQRCVINMMEETEVVSTMLLPASWWMMTNN
ncbi:N-terminal EF-hand calcium-binding protein 1 isoform X1 [Phycodurus eques]|uniref:N-terminal EF-hand calcium-binding protein 1 isoform X1 n=1 Tax=Phycodurus eques TaxID=693459 RepID=UPI002ACE6E9E|nr:N-terminal EF-hand calcium-binding protein 1 isoform X1 [Phycodurus eques]XP_061544785.1 N-terminal EF-hand calcium-binding protein 1 isoform X1 [Phycodurus eques]